MNPLVLIDFIHAVASISFILFEMTIAVGNPKSVENMFQTIKLLKFRSSYMNLSGL